MRHDHLMAGVPKLTKMAVSDKLVDHAAQHWPQLSQLTVPVPREPRLRHRDAARQQRAEPAVPTALDRPTRPVGLRAVHVQQREVRGPDPAQRQLHRHPRTSPGLRLHALPVRPRRLIPHELTGQTTKPDGRRSRSRSRMWPKCNRCTNASQCKTRTVGAQRGGCGPGGSARQLGSKRRGMVQTGTAVASIDQRLTCLRKKYVSDRYDVGTSRRSSTACNWTRPRLPLYRLVRRRGAGRGSQRAHPPRSDTVRRRPRRHGGKLAPNTRWRDTALLFADSATPPIPDAQPHSPRSTGHPSVRGLPGNNPDSQAQR